MKKHFSTIVFSRLGLCAGFTLCYIYVVVPERETNPTAAPPLQAIDRKTTISINVAGDGTLYFGGARIDMSRLRVILNEPDAHNRPVVIRAPKNAGLAAITAILDACRDAGVWQIAYATTMQD